MSIYAEDGVVKVKVKDELHPDKADELIEELRLASAAARRQIVNLVGVIPPLTGGTYDQERHVSVLRPGSEAHQAAEAAERKGKRKAS